MCVCVLIFVAVFISLVDSESLNEFYGSCSGGNNNNICENPGNSVLVVLDGNKLMEKWRNRRILLPRSSLFIHMFFFRLFALFLIRGYNFSLSFFSSPINCPKFKCLAYIHLHRPLILPYLDKDQRPPPKTCIYQKLPLKLKFRTTSVHIRTSLAFVATFSKRTRAAHRFASVVTCTIHTAFE